MKHNFLDINPVFKSYFEDADVHESRHIGVGGTALAFVLALLALLFHGINTYLMFWLGVPVFICSLIHIVLVCITGFIAMALYKMERDSRFVLLLAVTTSVLGVLGALGTLIALVLNLWHSRISQEFMEWYLSIFPKLRRRKPEKIFDDITYGRDENPRSYSVMPFMDVMSLGSEKQKRTALTRMTARFNPAFSQAFRIALNDSNNSIRVQAATSVARIERVFVERVIKLQDLSKRYPRDPQILLALAEHYDNYAFIGILDHDRELQNRELAREYYQAYLSQKPSDMNARIRIGRLLLRKGEADEAARWFDECILHGFVSDSLMVWYFEALFASGRYSELRKQARHFTGKIEEYRKIRPALCESILLWAGQAETKGEAA